MYAHRSDRIREQTVLTKYCTQCKVDLFLLSTIFVSNNLRKEKETGRLLVSVPDVLKKFC
jgi:hypothetical protein